MRVCRQSKRTVVQPLGLILCVGMCALVVAHAGIRPRGKYTGVVFFDRWDTCLLLNGHDIMYIAESQKEGLRPYAGEAIDLDATDVFQTLNPGDALIRKYKILGPSETAEGDSLRNDLRIEAEGDFAGNEPPAFLIKMTNVASHAIETGPGRFGPTLLGVNPKSVFTPSDGESVAWMTRVGLTNRCSSYFMADSKGSPVRAKFAVDPGCKFPDPLTLRPNQSVQCRVTFDIPAGEFQFIVGYVGAPVTSALVSNALSFRVEQDGTAVLEP